MQLRTGGQGWEDDWHRQEEKQLVQPENSSPCHTHCTNKGMPGML